MLKFILSLAVIKLILNIWKIIYLNCWKRYEDMIDHPSYTKNIGPYDLSSILWDCDVVTHKAPYSSLTIYLTLYIPDNSTSMVANRHLLPLSPLAVNKYALIPFTFTFNVPIPVPYI